LWLKLGDRNTAFSHKQTKDRARVLRNNVKEISLDDGIGIIDFQELKNATRTYFVNLFTEQDRVDPYVSIAMLENIPEVVLAANNTNLMKPIEEREIMDAIWNLEHDKALRHDGFSISFSKAFWSLTKTELKRILHFFKILLKWEATPTPFSLL
jgi:hypothetical protein